MTSTLPFASQSSCWRSAATRRVAACFALATALVASQVTAEQQILPLLPRNGMSFGDSLGRYGDWAIVGAPRDHFSNSGTARILLRTGSVWEETAMVRGVGSVDADHFGQAVAIDDFIGTRALVGAPYHDGYAGAAYVFVLQDGSWHQEAELVASDTSPYDMFGASVALFDDIALVGAWGHDGGGGNSGKVYVYERTGAVWQETGAILPDDPSAASQFGSAVALVGLGTVAVVGARSHRHGGYPAPVSGAAYVFFHIGGGWVQDGELLPSDPWDNMDFGGAVAAAGLGVRVVVGAGGTLSENHAGSAYVFERGADELWHQAARLGSGAGENRVGFGQAVAMSADGDHVVVGDAYALDQRGAVFGFERAGGVWRRAGTWTPNLATAAAKVGRSVALWDTQMLAGAPGDDSALPDAGAVYVEGELIFTDGFESGNTSAWSSSAP